MRKYISIPLKNGASVVYEIRPADLKLAIGFFLAAGLTKVSDVGEAQWTAAFVAAGVIRIPAREIELIDDEGQAAIKAAMDSVNHEFFHGDRWRRKRKSSPFSGDAADKDIVQLEKELDETCCMLAERGHNEVWHYGWSVYLAAQRVIQRQP